jgi:hypothetical protein
MGNSISFHRSSRWRDKVLGETVLNESFVFLSYGDGLTPRAFQEELISLFTQLIELVIFNVIQTGFFEPLQRTMGSHEEEFIEVGHGRSLLVAA